MKVKFAGTWVTLSGKEVKVGDIAPEFVAVKNDLGTFHGFAVTFSKSCE
ncbi:MAG: hypothetical protein AB9828_09205 [Sphaerochaetaceae bacterium]